MLSLTDVTVRYGDDAAAAVDTVNLTVARGEWVTFVGPNGAGKSSLLRAIAHLQPCTGNIVIGGEATANLSHRRLARMLAYVPQQPELPGGMTALEYTLLGRTPHIGYFGVESAADRRSCAALLDRLAVGALSGRPLPTLSGGEKQRVVLARALAQRAPVLLLDEPTSALDIGNRVEALELVDELRAEYGLTVISVMHDLTLAAQFAERLVLLSHGRIVAAGPASEVLRADSLARTFGPHVQVMPGPDGRPVVVPVRPGSATWGATIRPDAIPAATVRHAASPAAARQAAASAAATTPAAAATPAAAREDVATHPATMTSAATAAATTRAATTPESPIPKSPTPKSPTQESSTPAATTPDADSPPRAAARSFP